MNTEAMQTIAYLANELRKAHETAAQQHQVLMAQKRNIDDLQDEASRFKSREEAFGKTIENLQSLLNRRAENAATNDAPAGWPAPTGE